MNINKDGFSWVDLSSYSVLMFGNNYVAMLSVKESVSGAKSFSLDCTVGPTRYSNHALNAQSLAGAKRIAEETIASEYEKIINHAKITLEKYEGLATGLSALQKTQNHEVLPLADTINKANELKVAEKGACQDNVKETVLSEAL